MKNVFRFLLFHAMIAVALITPAPVSATTLGEQLQSTGHPNTRLCSLNVRRLGGFGRAALAAASGFIYKPTVVNGERVPVDGVRTRISFEIGD